ncbi:MAG: hypothetical protein IIB19_05675 [Chloroflexi bacterium]|nr:hypothetical protein [Chloroflexota bacterium]
MIDFFDLNKIRERLAGEFHRGFLRLIPGTGLRMEDDEGEDYTFVEELCEELEDFCLGADADARGEFSLSGLNRGRWSIIALHPTYGWQIRTLEITDRDRSINLRLPKAPAGGVDVGSSPPPPPSPLQALRATAVMATASSSNNDRIDIVDLLCSGHREAADVGRTIYDGKRET